MLHYVSLDPWLPQIQSRQPDLFLFLRFFGKLYPADFHDEVVHGKGSLMNKMPGSYEEKFAGMRSFPGVYDGTSGEKSSSLWAREFGQFKEWDLSKADLDWLLLHYPHPTGMLQPFVQFPQPVSTGRTRPLWAGGFFLGRIFLDCATTIMRRASLCFRRIDHRTGAERFSATSLRSSASLPDRRPGLAATYAEVFSTDAAEFGGTRHQQRRVIETEPVSMHGYRPVPRV